MWFPFRLSVLQEYCSESYRIDNNLEVLSAPHINVSCLLAYYYWTISSSFGLFYRFMTDILHTAVKVLDWGEDGVSSVAEIAALRTSFRQEVAVWHKLDHPNVAKVQLQVSFTRRIRYHTMSNKSNHSLLV